MKTSLFTTGALIVAATMSMNCASAPDEGSVDEPSEGAQATGENVALADVPEGQTVETAAAPGNGLIVDNEACKETTDTGMMGCPG
jgi:hypothetical protein